MKLFDNTLYFMYKQGLWRTSASASGNYKIKTFEASNNRYSLYTTSTNLYVYETGDNNQSTLWKLENGEFLSEVATYTPDSDMRFMGTYMDSLYFSKKNDNGKYDIIENQSGVETVLNPSFVSRPNIASKNGALYVSDALPNERDVTKYFWRLDGNSNSFIKVTQNRIGFAGSVSDSFQGMTLAHGNEFVSNRKSAFSRPSAILYKVENPEARNEIYSTGQIFNSYLQGDLYINARNVLVEGIRVTTVNHELFVINDSSGKMKKLATCLPD